jgi:hypothetical protein
MTYWDEVFLRGQVRIRKTKKKYKSDEFEKPRRIIRFKVSKKKKISYTYARVVWNCMHPEDLATPQEDVHHIDNDTLNDCPENLEKLPYSIHRSMKKSYYPKRKLKWDVEWAMKLLEEGLTRQEIAEKVGISYNRVCVKFQKLGGKTGVHASKNPPQIPQEIFK